MNHSDPSGSPRPSGGSTRVLFVADPLYGAIAAVRALRAGGYAPWLAVDRPGAYASRSRAAAGTVLVPDLKLDGERFVSEVAAAADRLSVEAVLPGAEPYLFALAGREERFKGAALGTPPRESVERATNKALLPEFATSSGLQTPPTKIVRGDSGAAATFGFPAIVKPLRSWIRNADGSISAYAARLVTDKKAAEEALRALPTGEALIQPYVSGQLVSVAGVSWAGELVCALHQASIRIWPLRTGVSSYAQTIPQNPALEQGVGRLLHKIGWSGLFQAQFIRDSQGQHYLIDINPRVYGSLALAVAAGLNLPGIWTDLLLGRRPQIRGYRVGARFRHEEKDVRALARMLVEGERRRVLGGVVPRRGTTHAIFSLRDPMPLLTSVERLAGWITR